MAYPRFLRVKNLLKKELSSIIRNDSKDPRLNLITITRIDLTPDCRFAKIYFGVLGENICPPGTLEGLRGATGYIRNLLRKRLDLRYIPELSFEFDRNIDYSLRIDQKINELKRQDYKSGRDTGS